MKVLILANNDVGLYKFRRELITELVAEHHEVFVCLPDGPYVPELERLGCRALCVEFNRHGMNPLHEAKLLARYYCTLRKVSPDIVFTYTIKPNVYGGVICRLLGIPYVANITGLGSALVSGGVLQKVTLFLYRCGLKKAQKVFFQNRENMEFMLNKHVIAGEYALLPGSGVNLEEHSFEEYPEENGRLVFLTIGRIMKAKGTDEVLEAARRIREEFPDTCFKLIGSFDGDYQEKVERAVAENVIEYLGSQKNVHQFIKNSHATIHASYHEGMSNVLLESAATGRPVIATDVPGCRETYIPEETGIACRAGDAESLVNAVRRFIALSYEDKAEMGCAGRAYIEKRFDRKIVVEAYMRELNRLAGVEG